MCAIEIMKVVNMQHVVKGALLSLQNKTNPLEREQSCLWLFEAISEKAGMLCGNIGFL